MPEEETENIVFEAMVSARDRKPFVQMTCYLKDGSPVFATQFRPSVATALGLRAVQAAIEAERDAGLIAFMYENGAEDKDVAMMLTGLRQHREQFDPEEGSMRALSDDDPSSS
jgi:hypothetical protein